MQPTTLMFSPGTKTATSKKLPSRKKITTTIRQTNNNPPPAHTSVSTITPIKINNINIIFLNINGIVDDTKLTSILIELEAHKPSIICLQETKLDPTNEAHMAS